jgi:recombination directionality factor gp3-like protein
MRTQLPTRLVDAQARLRQAGRIRTGYSTAVPGKTYRRPAKSPTFILTSQQRRDLEVAAVRWGGEIDRWKPQGGWPECWRLMTDTDTIEALLPPGEPLTSLMEFWTGPNCVRRCDGVTEYKGEPTTPGQARPCVCARVLGADWRERELSDQDKKNACKLTTRLSVFLPLSDLAYWRLDLHSEFAAVEMLGLYDLIRGRIGSDSAVPIRLRIEQRALPGKEFQVVVIEVSSQVAQLILSGVAPKLAIDGVTVVEERRALAATAENDDESEAEPSEATATEPPSDQETLKAQIAEAMTEADVQALLPAVNMTKDNELRRIWWARLHEVRRAAGDGSPTPPPKTAAAVSSEPVDVEQEPDRTAMWTATLTLAKARGWDIAEVSQRFRDFTNGLDPSAGDGWHHSLFRDAIESGKIQ